MISIDDLIDSVLRDEDNRESLEEIFGQGGAAKAILVALLAKLLSFSPMDYTIMGGKSSAKAIFNVGKEQYSITLEKK